jgi:uncharacterized protein (DUF1800 family)
MISRRRFVELGSTLAAASALACDDVPPQIGALLSAGAGPYPPPAGDDVDPITHAVGRMSFGLRPGDHARVRSLAADAERAVERHLDAQLAPDVIDDHAADARLARYAELGDSPGELYEYKEQVLLASLTTAALLRARYSERQLHAVMVDFWTDHFNIDSSKGDCRWLKAADDRDVIRAHALGSFPELLRASSVSPAMLWYLDGRVNRYGAPGDRPNENYARELLELHTLGVHGGYSQRDVMEVARALSGWTVRSRREVVFGLGKVEFRPEWHDDGEKQVLGRVIPAGLGSRDLDAVMDIVSLHPSTARHLATKLCRRFIADDPPAAAIVAAASTFVASRGNIASTLRTLFATPEFTNCRRTKLKRPFHFVVSALRATDARTDGGPALHEMLRRMGHAPYQYPTPEGYADDEASWLGTLLWRWNFAAALAGNRISGTRMEPGALRAALGGDDGLRAHLLGRRPTPAERDILAAVPDSLPLLLASPAFQRH